MAIRFDIKVFEQVKTTYMYYLKTGRVDNQQDLGKFDTYKPYLEADKEIKNLRKEIKSQKAAERSRVEKQKQEALKRLEAEKEAKKQKLIAIAEAKKIAKAIKKSDKEVPFYTGARVENLRRNQPRRIRGRVSPVASRLMDVKTFEDLKSLMSSSFIETVKSSDQLMLLRSAVIRCTKNHETEKEEFLKILEKRKSQLQDRANKVLKPKELCENPRADFISTPMGGQNKRY